MRFMAALLQFVLFCHLYPCFTLGSCYSCLQMCMERPDDDDYDRRQRRRHEEPLFVKVRRQLLTIAESVRFPAMTWLASV